MDIQEIELLSALAEARSEELEQGDIDMIWETKDGERIAYSELTVSHIENIIKYFDFSEGDMPNLFAERKKRAD